MGVPGTTDYIDFDDPSHPQRCASSSHSMTPRQSRYPSRMNTEHSPNLAINRGDYRMYEGAPAPPHIAARQGLPVDPSQGQWHASRNRPEEQTHFEGFNLNRSLRMLPWVSPTEFEFAYRYLYSPSQQHKATGVLITKVWATRVIHTPIAVEATTAIVEGQLLELDDKMDPSQVRRLYSLAIVRFVNGIVDQFSPHKSIVNKSQTIGVPTWVAEMRHRTTHGELPEMGHLKRGIAVVLNWLEKHFWIPALQSISDDRDYKNSGRRGGIIDHSSEELVTLSASANPIKAVRSLIDLYKKAYLSFLSEPQNSESKRNVFMHTTTALIDMIRETLPVGPFITALLTADQFRHTQVDENLDFSNAFGTFWQAFILGLYITWPSAIGLLLRECLETVKAARKSRLKSESRSRPTKNTNGVNGGEIVILDDASDDESGENLAAWETTSQASAPFELVASAWVYFIYGVIRPHKSKPPRPCLDIFPELDMETTFIQLLCHMEADTVPVLRALTRLMRIEMPESANVLGTLDMQLGTIPNTGVQQVDIDKLASEVKTLISDSGTGFSNEMSDRRDSELAKSATMLTSLESMDTDSRERLERQSFGSMLASVKVSRQALEMKQKQHYKFVYPETYVTTPFMTGHVIVSDIPPELDCREVRGRATVKEQVTYQIDLEELEDDLCCDLGNVTTLIPRSVSETEHAQFQAAPENANREIIRRNDAIISWEKEYSYSGDVLKRFRRAAGVR